ncbi:hypothetical protein ONA00_03960 [Mycoplasmopsis cynos]|nr:hypothetical protein [Mycoplasmopsis cynos]WAM10517.1 hypothetical protein ONA00_03960 [Mycoplasmopsis cynos]
MHTGDFDGLFRRMLAVSYEDIGFTNPQISQRTLTAINIFERLYCWRWIYYRYKYYWFSFIT